MAKNWTERISFGTIIVFFTFLIWSIPGWSTAGFMDEPQKTHETTLLEQRLVQASAECHREYQQWCRFPPIALRLERQCALWSECRDLNTVNLGSDLRWHAFGQWYERQKPAGIAVLLLIVALFALLPEQVDTKKKAKEAASETVEKSAETEKLQDKAVGTTGWTARFAIGAFSAFFVLLFWSIPAGAHAGFGDSTHETTLLEQRFMRASADCYRDFQQWCRFPPIAPRLQPQCEMWRQCRDFDTVGFASELRWHAFGQYFEAWMPAVIGMLLGIFAFCILAPEEVDTYEKSNESASGTVGKTPEAGKKQDKAVGTRW
ncbi:hypothetical protein JCM10207_000093 [Rhodosporidiobolus poonsookiae]